VGVQGDQEEVGLRVEVVFAGFIDRCELSLVPMLFVSNASPDALHRDSARLGAECLNVIPTKNEKHKNDTVYAKFLIKEAISFAIGRPVKISIQYH
jgi:hypothetical protein